MNNNCSQIPANLSGSTLKAFSWKSFIVAIPITLIIAVLAAAANPGARVKGIHWTLMWIVLTVESWKFWKWKSLIPYPACLLFALLAKALVGGAEGGFDWRMIIVGGAFNIVGITIFAIIYFLRFKKEACENQKKGYIQPLKYRNKTSSEMDHKSFGEKDYQSADIIDSNDSSNPMLTECAACGKQLSKRATACPQCGIVQTKECQVCKSKISVDNKECPECGDPFPFRKDTPSQTENEDISRNSHKNSLLDKNEKISEHNPFG